MSKQLICVDKNDLEIGIGEKIAIHKTGQLHRAFSLFIYRKEENKFLLQKRSKEKYHSGGKWSNSCCSHPYKDETWYDSLQRCVADELNTKLELNERIKCQGNMSPSFIDKRLFFAGSFVYLSEYGNISEHEYDYVFIYLADSNMANIKFNPMEVSEIKWLTLEQIDELLMQHGDEFTSWFSKAYAIAKEEISNFN